MSDLYEVFTNIQFKDGDDKERITEITNTIIRDLIGALHNYKNINLSTDMLITVEQYNRFHIHIPEQGVFIRIPFTGTFIGDKNV